ncbi:MAG: STAS domain-containing protein [Acidobacteriota bacterium]
MNRADIHVHTTYSDGAATPEDVLNYYAANSEMRVLAITDHDTMDGAFRAQRFKEQNEDLFGHIDLIIGEEVSSREGHILGLYLKEWIPPGMSAADTVTAIHSQGGIAIAAHPYTSWMKFMGLEGVGDLILELPFDAIETRNANFTEVFANRHAAKMAVGQAEVGASDAHFLDAVGLCYTDFPGENGADFRRAIEASKTVAGGRCYGAPTLMAYVIDRLRSGGKIAPSRDALRDLPDGGDFEVRVHAESSFLGSILHVEGRLRSGTTQLLDDTLRLLFESGVGAVLEMSKLEFIDSEGLTVLVRALKESRKRGLGFVLLSPSPQALNSLRVARLHRALTVTSDLEEAKREVEARGQALLSNPVRAPEASLEASERRSA